MADKVYPLKYERSSEGGTQDDERATEMSPGEDGFVAKQMMIVADEQIQERKQFSKV